MKTPRSSRASEVVARRRFLRLREELGLGGPPDLATQEGPKARVDVVVVPARPGYIHPLGRSDIKRALDFFGPIAIYGLRSVELRQAPDSSPRGLPVARYRVPGTVVLYEQRKPPWSVGRLSADAIERLQRAGASVEQGAGGARVDWTAKALQDFMLFDGLMHEIGHHLIQQHTGKRTARVMRTADHERRAAAFADKCRRAWANAESL